MNSKLDKVTILAVGGGAGKIVRALASANQDVRWIHLAYLDTDIRDLEFTEGVLHLPLGTEWTHDQGCGDDPLLGQHAAEASGQAIRELIASSDLLIVVSCLGGGTGSGAIPVLARLAKELDLLTIFLLSQPLSGEGNGPRQLADSAMRAVRLETDIVIGVPNDLLFNQLPPETPVAEAFALANRVFADCLLGLAELVRCRGLIPIDHASLKTALKGREAQCSFGIGRATGEGQDQAVVENLFASPLLGGKEFLDRADVIIATLVGGAGLVIGDLTRALGTLNSRLPQSARSFLGANLAPERGDGLQLTMLAIQYVKPHPAAGGRRQAGPRGQRVGVGRPGLDGTRQFKLPFVEEAGSLGIFSSSPPTTWQSENLDFPTFQRRGLAVDLDA